MSVLFSSHCSGVRRRVTKPLLLLDSLRLPILNLMHQTLPMNNSLTGLSASLPVPLPFTFSINLHDTTCALSFRTCQAIPVCHRLQSHIPSCQTFFSAHHNHFPITLYHVNFSCFFSKFILHDVKFSFLSFISGKVLMHIQIVPPHVTDN